MAQLRRFYTRVVDASNSAITSATISFLRVGAEVTRDASSGVFQVGVRHPGALKQNDVAYVIRSGEILSGVELTLSDPQWYYDAGQNDWYMEMSSGGSGSYTPTAGDRLVLTGLSASHKVDVFDNDSGDGSAGDPSVDADGVISGYVDAPDIDVKVEYNGSTTYITDLSSEGREWVTPEDFGAAGDGTTDDGPSIKVASYYAGLVGQHKEVRFGPKTYAMSSTQLGSYASGVKWRCTPATTFLATSGYGSSERLLILKDLDRFEIDGGLFTMNKQYVTGEQRHCIIIQGGNSIRLQNVSTEYSGGDGIYVGDSGITGAAEDIVIDGGRHRGHRRQGISITYASGVRVVNCRIEDIGRNATVGGTNPMAGIDVEPNSGEVCDQISIENCTFSRCRFGVLVYMAVADKTVPSTITCSNLQAFQCDVGYAVGRSPDRISGNELAVTFNGCTAIDLLEDGAGSGSGPWGMYLYDICGGTIVNADLAVSSSDAQAEAVRINRDNSAVISLVDGAESPTVNAEISMAGTFAYCIAVTISTATQNYADGMNFRFYNSQATLTTTANIGQNCHPKLWAEVPVVRTISASTSVTNGSSHAGLRIQSMDTADQTITIDDSDYLAGGRVRVRNAIAGGGRLAVTNDGGRTMIPGGANDTVYCDQYGAEALFEKDSLNDWRIIEQVGPWYPLGVETIASATNISPREDTTLLEITGTTRVDSIANCWPGRRLTIIFTDASPGGTGAIATPVDDEIVTAITATRYLAYTLVGFDDGSYTRWYQHS